MVFKNPLGTLNTQENNHQKQREVTWLYHGTQKCIGQNSLWTQDKEKKKPEQLWNIDIK